MQYKAVAKTSLVVEKRCVVSVQDCIAKYSNFTYYFKRRLENLASVAHDMMHRDTREIVLHPSGDILLGPTAKQN